MKVIRIYDMLRNDCTMDCICEHCGQIKKDTAAYNDNFYINTVVGESYCKHCGKNREGDFNSAAISKK